MGFNRPMPESVQWPGRPPLFEGESLSSWLARIANANALPTRQLCGALDHSRYQGLRDMDRHADSEFISRVAILIGENPEKVGKATFKCWAGNIYEFDDGRLRLEWAPPVGRIRGRRCFGQQICPLCLEEDVQPHLRLNWRLSFLTACQIHGCLLLDRCHACGEPFHPLKCLSPYGFRCENCGAEPTSVEPEDIIPEAIDAQINLFASMSSGWCDLGAYGPAYSFVGLKILALLCRLLAGGFHALPLRRYVLARINLPERKLSHLRLVRDHSILPPKERAVVITMAYFLLTDWPVNFLAAAEDASLHSSHIRKRHDEKKLPFAFQHVIDFHLKKRHEIGGRDELIALQHLLKSRGEQPTYRNLVRLAGRKRSAFEMEAERASSGDEWGQGQYWKLAGISPELKKAVRKAAHNAGLNVAAFVEEVLRRELRLKARVDKNFKN